MEIKPIRTEEDYLAALDEIETLFDAEPDSPEGEKLDVLVTIVEAYEEKNYKIPLPNPIEAILYHMERLGLSRKDLERFIGNRARVSEILNYKRPLSIRMIRNLSEGLGIPTEILIRDYPIRNEINQEEEIGPSKTKVANIWLSELSNPVSFFMNSNAGNGPEISFSESLKTKLKSLDEDITNNSASNGCFYVEEASVLVPDWPVRYTNNCETDRSNWTSNSHLQRIV